MLIEKVVTSYIIGNNKKIKINSKEIKKNDIFLALQGKNFHGNKFINDSFKSGAKFCITDKIPKSKTNIENILIVKDIFNFLKKISKTKRKLFKGKVIGITGSAGKTTLKETLFFFLKKKFKTSVSVKSYNNILGVLITILNMDLKSKFAIFELGTNNFGEIRNIVSIVKPSQIFITNIQSTHLENFKNKINISKEKSDIFKLKYNSNAQILYLSNTNAAENNILKLAKKEKIKKIITFGNFNSENFIKKIIQNNKFYKIDLSIDNKIIKINSKQKEIHRLNNLLFVFSFFIQNNISIDIIKKNNQKLTPFVGRGKIHNLKINKLKLKLIDESYNANPETMQQTIKNFSDLETNKTKKIIILGDMNELGVYSIKYHYEVLICIEKLSFNKVILCGELFKSAVKKLVNPKNKFIYKQNSKQLLNYVKNKIHNNAIIMIKCSNATEVNKFANILLNKSGS
tara:strand:- start:236 stop:1609 length:1374 start_codon:yes stop_codon:yes gene_type:complete